MRDEERLEKELFNVILDLNKSYMQILPAFFKP